MGSISFYWARPAAAALVTIACLAVHADRIVDEIVATVDTEPILMSDILIEAGPQVNELRANSASETDYNTAVDKLIQDTLDQAIDSRILVREARLAGLEIPDDMVEKRLEDYKKLFESPEAFQKELERAGENLTEVRERLRKQILARGMAARKQQEFEKGIVVSESDVAQFYQDNLEQFKHDERVRVRQIFLTAPNDPAQREVAKARLQSLKDELAAGADFKELAIEYSQAPGADAGGIIGWVNQGDLVPVLNDAAFTQEVGMVGDIIESDGGLHILLVEGKEPAGTVSLEEARKEIEPRLRQVEASKRFEKWMAELRKTSRVQVFM
ncbi:MAG: hypothetical protein AMXMBFR84_02950 [Candidatus Hydrogenedentota bacterium]